MITTFFVQGIQCHKCIKLINKFYSIYMQHLITCLEDWDEKAIHYAFLIVSYLATF